MSKSNIMRYSMDELRAKQARGESQTDWARLDNMTEDEIEHKADADDVELGIIGWDLDSIQLVTPQKKQAVSLRLDEEIISFFRAQGPGYQTRINAVLRHYVNETKKKVRA